MIKLRVEETCFQQMSLCTVVFTRCLCTVVFTRCLCTVVFTRCLCTAVFTRCLCTVVFTRCLCTAVFTRCLCTAVFTRSLCTAVFTRCPVLIAHAMICDAGAASPVFWGLGGGVGPVARSQLGSLMHNVGALTNGSRPRCSVVVHTNRHCSERGYF
jgi:hypothetical protein